MQLDAPHIATVRAMASSNEAYDGWKVGQIGGMRDAHIKQQVVVPGSYGAYIDRRELEAGPAMIDELGIIVPMGVKL